MKKSLNIFVLLLFSLFMLLGANAMPVSNRASAILCANDVEGEGFFHVDWQKLPLDSILPRYTEVIPLESDFRLFDYKVRILYPEWAVMSKAEVGKMEHWADSVAADLNIRTFVGVMRGTGQLDVDFVPVVKREGKYLKLISGRMEIRAVTKSSSPLHSSKHAKAPSQVRYTRKSKLAEGRWVKIAIKDDGMYRLTSNSLRKMGFSNPQNVHLYGHGGHRMSEVSNPDEEYDDIEEVPLYQVDGDTWLFWCNGLMHWEGDKRIFNQYATSASYFLVEESAPSKIDKVDGTKIVSGPTITSFRDHTLYEKDEFAYAQLGRNLVEEANFANNSLRTYTLSVPAETLGNEQLEISFTASASTATTLSPEVNGTSLTAISLSAVGNYQAATGITKTYDVSQYANGKDWEVRLSSTSGHDAHLDYIALHYSRPINPGQSFVQFGCETQGEATFKFSGANEGTAVMQLGEPGLPACMIEGKQAAGTLTFSTDDASRRFVCFQTNAAFPEPTIVGEVVNQNLHALDSLDMVIIIPESGKLESEALRLVEAHKQYDGLRCAVVRADQVYNEFSSGTPDATAYRRLMKMLYDRAEGDEDQMPRYLLLMGDCTFDNRMLTPAWRRRSPKDYLLCFESENSFSDTESYVMEDYFALLDDGEGGNLTREKVDIAVGRFPVTTSDEARIMVDKVVDFISNSNAGAWKNVVSFLGDDGDSNSHMRYADDVAEQVIRDCPEMEVRKTMWDAYTRVSTLSTNTYPGVVSQLKKQQEEGALLVNYTGHGAPYVLSHESVWHTSDFTSFKGRNLPVWYTAACDTAPFDGTTVNMAEEAVLTEGGGALAFIGTARTVYASNNWNLNKFFCRYIFAKDEKGHRYRLGDALRMAKASSVGTETGNPQNKLQYCLLGDPAILLGAPMNRVHLTSLTNSETGKVVEGIKAGMPVTVEGEVRDADERLLESFKGMVSLRVYDSMDTITCRRNDPNIADAFVFSDRNSILYVGQDSVKAGRFKISFVVPKDIKYSNAEGRMVFYAINDRLDMEANGYYEDFVIGGTAEITDSIGPEILLSLNGEPGGTVNSSPYLLARLSDVSGVNVTGNGIGHDLLLCIDNNPAWTYNLNEYYVSDFGDFTKGSLGFTIPSLPAGQHTLSLRAWDMLNNTSLAQMDFVVDASYEPALSSVGASPNPAQTHTTFFFSNDLPGTECEFSVEVFDFAGRELWRHDGVGSSKTGQYSVPWNLSLGNGSGRVGSGVYLYRITISAGDSKRVAKSQKLIVK